MPVNRNLPIDLQTSLGAVPARRVSVGARHVFDRRCAALQYVVRLAQLSEEKAASFRLRFLVFNLELHEGLESAYATGYDTDEFDEVCDHLIVEHKPTSRVIATYRMQTGSTAAKNLGYYSEREFDLAPFEAHRDAVVEVGRAAILKEHRSFEVLSLLWKGIAAYAQERRCRFLLGCSSFASQDPAEGLTLYRELELFLAPLEFRTSPQRGFEVVADSSTAQRACASTPRLLRAYLNLGARICGAPALDREFKTIDFLTLLDLESLSPTARSRFLSAA